jgi:hypothetical protein
MKKRQEREEWKWNQQDYRRPALDRKRDWTAFCEGMEGQWRDGKVAKKVEDHDGRR